MPFDYCGYRCKPCEPCLKTKLIADIKHVCSIGRKHGGKCHWVREDSVHNPRRRPPRLRHRGRVTARG